MQKRSVILHKSLFNSYFYFRISLLKLVSPILTDFAVKRTSRRNPISRLLAVTKKSMTNSTKRLISSRRA